MGFSRVDFRKRKATGVFDRCLRQRVSNRVCADYSGGSGALGTKLGMVFYASVDIYVSRAVVVFICVV